MTLLVALLGTSSALIVLAAGYLLGAKQGAKARERLWEQSLAQAQEQLTSERQRREEPVEEEGLRHSQRDLETLLRPLQQQVTGLQQMLQPLAKWIGEAAPPRSAVDEASSPQLQSERLETALADVDTEAGHQHNLTLLLNEAAVLGGFRTLVLSDNQGLTLAHSDDAWELDRIVGMSSLLLVLAERISREGAPAPVSLMVQDEEDNLILCRAFCVQDARLLLTAVATGVEMTPSTLDPILSMVDRILNPQLRFGAGVPA